jgi:hypothetical protein
LALCFVIAGSAAQSQQPELHYLFEEAVGGVYTQSWSAVEIGDVFLDGRFDVYVISEGKLGNFLGVIGVHCETPRFSRWRVTGGNLHTSDVPAEAITGIRDLACNG